MNVIEVSGICKSFGKTKALEEVCLEVKQGELFGLIGPDGAGKSTLFDILVTLLNPDKGTGLIDGKDLMKQYKEIRQIIGYLPGSFSLYGDLSCQENLDFFADLYGETIKQNYHLIAPIWEQLLPFKNRRAADLSGGMKQKLSLCCALIHKPKILFLDEPTTGVDPVSRKDLWNILQSLKQYNVTVFVSTSYMEESSLCDRIALIHNGKILGSNCPQVIKDHFSAPIVAIETDRIYQLLKNLEGFAAKDIYPSGQTVKVVLYQQQDIDLLKKEIQSMDINVKNVFFDKPTIEDCFISLIKQANSQSLSLIV